LINKIISASNLSDSLECTTVTEKSQLQVSVNENSEASLRSNAASQIISQENSFNNHRLNQNENENSSNNSAPHPEDFLRLPPFSTLDQPILLNPYGFSFPKSTNASAFNPATASSTSKGMIDIQSTQQFLLQQYQQILLAQ
jgi:hypothetical protein